MVTKFTITFQKKSFSQEELSLLLTGVRRDWLGCKISLRYSYWDKNHWSYLSPISDGAINHVVDDGYRVEEFKLSVRDIVYIVNPN